MKTAVDTNIFVDILIGSPSADLSRELLRQARTEGTVVICPTLKIEPDGIKARLAYARALVATTNESMDTAAKS